MQNDVTIRVIENQQEFAELAPLWADLWTADSQAKPFQHPAWLLPWWNHFGTSNLLACTFWSGGQLVGLLPTYIYQPPASEERQLLLIGAGTSDYLDGLFRHPCTPEHVRVALRLLNREPGWDVAFFTQLLSGSLLSQALQQVDPAAVTRFPGESCSRTPALPIGRLPKKVRADVLYFRNAAIGRGKLQLKLASSSDALPTFELLVQLHTARWQAANEPGVLADPHVLAWHREAIPQLTEAGLLRLYSLELAAVPIAALYALTDPPERKQRTESFYLIGTSPAHADLHPGTLLSALAVEHAAQDGVQTIDMLRGEEVYKKFWHVQEVPTYGFAVRRATVEPPPLPGSSVCGSPARC